VQADAPQSGPFSHIGDSRFDCLVQTGGLTLAVEAKYRSRGSFVRSELLRLATTAQASGFPLLMVTNTFQVNAYEIEKELAKLPLPSVAVRWGSPDDDGPLRDAIRRLVELASDR
jgi:hypothetical protein